jgi:hypothetical protein
MWPNTFDYTFTAVAVTVAVTVTVTGVDKAALWDTLCSV